MLATIGVAKPMQEQEPSNFTAKELISIFTVIVTLIGAAVSFGVMYGKVQRLDDSNKDFSQSLQKTREELVEVKTQNKQLLDFIQDIKSDIAIIKQKQDSATRR